MRAFDYAPLPPDGSIFVVDGKSGPEFYRMRTTGRRPEIVPLPEGERRALLAAAVWRFCLAASVVAAHRWLHVRRLALRTLYRMPRLPDPNLEATAFALRIELTNPLPEAEVSPDVLRAMEAVFNPPPPPKSVPWWRRWVHAC